MSIFCDRYRLFVAKMKFLLPKVTYRIILITGQFLKATLKRFLRLSIFCDRNRLFCLKDDVPFSERDLQNLTYKRVLTNIDNTTSVMSHLNQKLNSLPEHLISSPSFRWGPFWVVFNFLWFVLCTTCTSYKYFVFSNEVMSDYFWVWMFFWYLSLRLHVVLKMSFAYMIINA